MSTSPHIEAPLDPRQLSQRCQAMCADPTFDDVPAKIELDEWGKIILGPLGKHRVEAHSVACRAESPSFPVNIPDLFLP